MNKLLYLLVASMMATGAYSFAEEEGATNGEAMECPEGQVMNEELGICVPAPAAVEETTEEVDVTE